MSGYIETSCSCKNIFKIKCASSSSSSSDQVILDASSEIGDAGVESESNQSSDTERSRSSKSSSESTVASNLPESENEGYVADQSDCEDMLAKCRVFKRQYKNTSNILVAIDFWHGNCQYDTNSSLNFSVLNNLDRNQPYYELHRQLLQDIPSRELFSKFLICQPYLDQLARNNNDTVGF